MFRKTVLAVVFLLLVLGAVASWHVNEHKEELFVWPEKREALVRSLTEPDSARFRRQALKRRNYLCGEVNIKDTYGRYLGYKRFVSFEGGYAVDEQEIIAWPGDNRDTLYATSLVLAEARGRALGAKKLTPAEFADKMFNAIWSSISNA